VVHNINSGVQRRRESRHEVRCQSCWGGTADNGIWGVS